MQATGEECLCRQNFGKLWRSCFSYVKIRAHKAVTGKCDACCYLSHSRRTYHDSEARTYITTMHALHRTMYMGERLEYYKRRQEALLYPDKVWSLIGDGMAQNHSQLPYLAAMKDTDRLPQHLQGVLCHGKMMRVYRTYHNVRNDTNMAIHTFLLAIEELKELNGGKLPETIFYQIDGGSENTAKVMFGLAELFVVKRLCKLFVLTRLPVGHTHEDIDAKFAKIWVAVRGEFCATMEAYRKKIEAALTSKQAPVKVVDIFVVPDYVSYLSPCMDNKFGRYCKTTWTQLQWKFECVEVCDDFPLGVKTSYRTFCADRVKEIVTDHKEKYGFQCQDVQVQWFPEATETAPAGMYLLQSIPTGEIKPEAFIEKSRAELDRIVSRVQHQFTPGHNRVGVPPTANNLCHGDAIVAEWIDFATNIAPASDDADEYCTLIPLYIPLLHELFTCDNVVIPRHLATQCKIPSIPQVRALDSVNWGRRNVPRNKNDPAKHTSRNPITENNECKRRKQSITSSSEDSDGEEEYAYRKLSRLEKIQNHELYSLSVKHFTMSMMMTDQL